MNEYNITSLAYYYKHHVSGDDGTNEYFGKDGERTDRMMQNHDALTKFWSAAERGGGEGGSPSTTSTSGGASAPPGGDVTGVVLLGMHGVDLADDARLLATLQQMHRMDYGAACFLLERIRQIVEALPGGYDNPLLTANAIAIQSADPIDGRSERDSVIIGDGIYEFIEWLGLGDDGIAYIHSHEFSHHVQYDLGIGYGSAASAVDTAVETRWWEMMADSFGAYFNAHSAGGRMDDAALMNVHRAAFSLGDCEDAVDSHHGHPRQRECASTYGADLALVSYYNDGHIIPPSVLRELFDEKYERMVRLDDEQCTAVVDESVLDVEIYGEVRDSDTDYSSYFDGFYYHLDHSFVDEMDKPPPILQDENGTVMTKVETGFWGGDVQWISEHTSAAGHSDIGFTFVAPILAYILLR
ncbi:hypothetical protein ACHAW5_011082 [Stephanodiscus triporus]|uniref:Peptidase M48 domain-containing protein n=1 Tax=Stephanodiscus triporus TaxID=2934178 RepID=A0ABD3QMC4_9STRA